MKMMGSGMNLITTVIGFGMSATFIVFVCTRIICGRLRGVESRPMFEIETRIDPEQVCLIPSAQFFTIPDLGIFLSIRRSVLCVSVCVYAYIYMSNLM